MQTGDETETGAETSGAGLEPKAKRPRRPNQLMSTRLVVTEMDDSIFETIAPEEARLCYDNQIGCIIWTTATINDGKLQKIDNMRPSLLKKLHQIFLFPDHNEKDNKDPEGPGNEEDKQTRHDQV